MFSFVYPDQRHQIPRRITDELLCRVAAEASEPGSHVCNGTLLSREQYLDDLESFGYADGRLEPHGRMTREQVALWTAAIPNS